MLILLRKVGEQIVIGREIIISVARVTRNRVFLTVEAPKHVRVDRQEIRSAKTRELQAAGASQSAEAQTGVGDRGES
jgi:carbon storage regulator